MTSTNTARKRISPPVEPPRLPGGVPADGGPGLTDAIQADAVSSGCAGLPEIINAANWITSDPPKSDPVFDDVFDLGDKVCIIAASKMRKSFFALQMGIHLAAGHDYLDWTSARSFRVLIVQAEIKTSHYHRRVKRLHEAIGGPDIGDRLHVMNARGCDALTIEAVGTVAKNIGAEIVMFDPLYKFATGDENAAHDMKPVLAGFDRLAQDTGAAVVYVHHDPKGDASQRDIRDRGSGSGVLARDYDACITLTAHRDHPDTAVVHTLLRNHPPRDPFCATWDDGRFVYDDIPVVTGKPRKYDEPYRAFIASHPDATLSEVAAAIGCDRSTASRLKKQLGVA